MHVLISGASIAGPALAYWLHRYGFDVTVINQKIGRIAVGSMIEKSNFKIFLRNLLLRVPTLMAVQFKMVSKMIAKAANGIELKDY
ncbi:hypothetical protein QNK12_15545 [Neobacillus cucumis]|nr:hypothetical protein QNK12_15545 [Neobacillus cucumis]